MTYEGNVTEIIFRNDDNGYTVGNLKTTEGELTFVGSFVAINEGESMIMEGKEKIHPIYGQQIEVLSYKLPSLDTDKSIFNYLASGNIDEIGPKLAERIVNKFGTSTLEIFDKHPERLLEVEGIGRKKFNRIITSYQARSAQRSIVIELSGYDISTAIAMRIYRAFGEKTMEVLHENPYLIAAKVRGVGFLKTDEIAMKMGIPKDSIHRITEGIKYILTEAGYNGDTYVLLEELKARSAQILECSAEKVEESIYELAIKKEIVLEKFVKQPSAAKDVQNAAYEDASLSQNKASNIEERVYLYGVYECEAEIAVKLLKLMGQSKMTEVFQREAETMVKEAEDRIGKQLEAMQKEAVINALNNNVMVLTGGPGTGKTTIISFLISCFEELHKVVKLCAPTGRAAKRMSEATGKKAMTIHRLLEVGFSGDEEENFYNKDEDNPIEADVIIVDEVSMVDIFLMRALLRAVPRNCALIFVGDKDQLPSVGLGRVLQDMIDSQIVSTTTLNEIFRQSKESSIIVNAHRVNKGEALEIPKDNKDFFFMQRENLAETQALVVELVSERLPKYFNVDPREIQVLCPIKKTAVGVFELNIRLQEMMNPQEDDRVPKKKKQFKHQDRILRVGDKIMQIKNNYEKEYIGYYGAESGKGVFNGDIGYIENIDNVAKEFFVKWEDQRVSKYGFDEADNIEHAYAMTVHKSQGSEFEVVVIPILNLPPMMQSRNILYTALTRAKSAVVLVGSPRQVNRMIQNNHTDKRNSSLADKLRTMQPMVLEKGEL